MGHGGGGQSRWQRDDEGLSQKKSKDRGPWTACECGGDWAYDNFIASKARRGKFVDCKSCGRYIGDRWEGD